MFGLKGFQNRARLQAVRDPEAYTWSYAFWNTLTATSFAFVNYGEAHPAIVVFIIITEQLL